MAAQQTAPLFPLTFLAYILPFWHSLAWIAALKVFLAAMGAFVYARSLRLFMAPSLLAGVSYGFGSYFVIWLEHPHSTIFMLLPWMLWFTDRTLLRGGTRWAAGLALVVGLTLLAGHPQSALVNVMVVAAYALFRVFFGGPAGAEEPGGVPAGLRVRRSGSSQAHARWAAPSGRYDFPSSKRSARERTSPAAGRVR